MRRTIRATIAAALLVSLAVLPAFAAQTPPAAASSKEALDVLGKMIEAMGGRKVLESIKDTTISGNLEINQAGATLTASITIYQKEPNKMRLDITIAEYNMSITQATDGQKAWFTNAQTGTTEEMPDFMAKEFARQALGNQTILEPGKAGVSYALKPKTSIEGKDYIVLEQTLPDGHKVTIFIDPATHLPYKTQTLTLDQTGAEVEAESFSTDYRKVGDTMIAHSLRVFHNGAEAQKIAITSVTYNTNLEDAFFVLK
jgi:lipopolysaccharide export system protein LptA